MIRLFIILAVLVAAAFGFVWLSDRPGTLMLTWQSYQIEVPLIIAVIGLIGIMLILAFVASIFRTLWRSPHMLAGYFSARKRDRGYRALSKGLIAVGEGDIGSAKKAALDAKRLLPDTPLALLLQAQAAQLAGEYTSAHHTFEQMLETPKTRFLGLRGLFMEAERTGSSKLALQLAVTAMDEANNNTVSGRDSSAVAAWAGPAVLRYQAAAQDWNGALKTLAGNISSGHLNRKEGKRKRAVVLVAKALSQEDHAPQDAKTTVLEAHKLSPELVPAAVLAGRVLSRLGELRRAVKVIETTWKTNPHPELADVYAHIRPGDAPRDRVKRISTLTRLSPDHIESAEALAKFAIEASDWPQARKALRAHLSKPTQRICLLMADIEEGEHGDKGRVREWLSKAVHALPDPVWISDGIVSDHWAPVSPVTGDIDSYSWKIPPNTNTRPVLTIDDDDALLMPLPLPDLSDEEVKTNDEIIEEKSVEAELEPVVEKEIPAIEKPDIEEPEILNSDDRQPVPDDPGTEVEEDKGFKLF